MICTPARTIYTELGWVSLLGHGQSLCHLSFGHSRESAAWLAIRRFCEEMGMEPDPYEETTWLDQLALRVERYAQGCVDEFRDVPVLMTGRTKFQARVLQACRAIDYGETLQYCELASRCGAPRAARAVGNVMAGNRVPLIIPCHRVVARGDKLGGFSAPGGISTKRKLLALESGRNPPAKRVRPPRPRALQPH